MKTNHRMFCYPCLPDEAYLAYLTKNFEKFAYAETYAREVMPNQSKTFPEKAVQARLRILQRVYRGEYFTDSHDVPRLADQVRREREFIWFWGKPESIAGLLSPIKDVHPSEMQLGTVSVIDSSNEFGDGFGEICRSGSMSSVSILPYAIKRILDYLKGAIPTLTSSFHTLVLVPRVRPASGSISGGKSVNTLHRKYIRSRFWGFAPWYVMQGGFLECLEYREVNRSTRDLAAGITAFPYVHIGTQQEADFVQALFSLNFPDMPVRVIVTEKAGKQSPSRFKQKSAPPFALLPYNHVTFEVLMDTSSEQALTLEQLEPIRSGQACTVVNVDLSNQRSVPLQNQLRQAGYRLTCIRPARIIESNTECDKGKKFCTYGSWAKPNPRLILAEPFYIGERVGSATEKIILRYLQSLVRFWQTREE